MTQCLVTGGAGFIGSHLVRGILQRGWRVRVLDDLSSGHRKNLDELGDKVELVVGDICDAAVCHRAVAGCDYVFHMAAMGSVPRSVDDPMRTHRINDTGTLNILVAARDAKARRVVFSASSSAYGDTPTLPKREDMMPRPLSPYAVSKLAGENYCKAFTACYGLQTISLRYFNVFGPRQDPNSQYAAVIPAFISRLLKGERPVIYGDGGQTRDFCYVDNVVNANLLAAEAASLNGETVNIACGESISLNAMLRVMNDSLGTKVEPIYEPVRKGDVRDSLAALDEAKRVIGYVPRVTFEDGLRRSIEWYRANLR
ncbi:MAG: SDR family oxidoreductase [Phycisphaerae bacterium]|nr:SDR family oxidoreductase [Phycisphaerae bacterium]